MGAPEPPPGGGRRGGQPRRGPGLSGLAVAGPDGPGAGRGIRRQRAGHDRVARDRDGPAFHPAAQLPRLPPGEPRREARRRPLPGPRAVQLREPGAMAGPGGPQQAERAPQDHRHHTRRRYRVPRRGGDAAPHRQRPAGLRERPRRPAHQGPARPRGRARRRCRRDRSRRGGRSGHRGSAGHRRDGADGAGATRRRPGHRRLRMERGARHRVPARAHDGADVRPDEHRRRPAHGHAGRCPAGQHGPGVVGARREDPGRRGLRRAAVEPGQPRAHPARLDPREPSWSALHQRGDELQRPRRRLPPDGLPVLRLCEPARLADLRRAQRRAVRLLRHARRGARRGLDPACRARRAS